MFSPRKKKYKVSNFFLRKQQIRRCSYSKAVKEKSLHPNQPKNFSRSAITTTENKPKPPKADIIPDTLPYLNNPRKFGCKLYTYWQQADCVLSCLQYFPQRSKFYVSLYMIITNRYTTTTAASATNKRKTFIMHIRYTSNFLPGKHHNMYRCYIICTCVIFSRSRGMIK